MKNAVIYARYSSQRQNEESIEQQVSECKKHAQNAKYRVVRVYADEALTGRNDKRPQFQRMIRDAESGLFDVIIAYKSNRIARNMLQALIYEDKLTRYGVTVEYVKEYFGNTASGRFALRSMMNLNQFYSENMGEDIKRAMRANAEECKVNSGSLAYGYKKGDDGRYALDEDRAGIVREIFTKYADGVPPSDIVRQLNARGIKTAKGREFRMQTITRILRTETYKGVYTWGDVVKPDGVPRIISDELFDAVQDRLNRNKHRKATTWHKYLLSGKAVCGLCGAHFVGVSSVNRFGVEYTYYSCSNKNRGKCTKKPIKRDVLDDLVISNAVDQLTDENIKAISNALAELIKEETPEIEQIKQTLRDTDIKIKNLVAFLAGGESVAVREELERLEALKLECKTALAESQIDAEIVADFLRFVKEKQNNNTRSTITDILVDTVTVYDDHIDITYNISNKKGRTPCLHTSRVVNHTANYTNTIYRTKLVATIPTRTTR